MHQHDIDTQMLLEHGKLPPVNERGMIPVPPIQPMELVDIVICDYNDTKGYLFEHELNKGLFLYIVHTRGKEVAIGATRIESVAREKMDLMIQRQTCPYDL